MVFTMSYANELYYLNCRGWRSLWFNMLFCLLLKWWMVIDLLCMLHMWSFIYNLSLSLSQTSISQHLSSQKIFFLKKCLLLQSKPAKHEKVFELVLGEWIILFCRNNLIIVLFWPFFFFSINHMSSSCIVYYFVLTI